MKKMLFLALAAIATGCYSMPSGNNYYSATPDTNNPAITTRLKCGYYDDPEIYEATRDALLN